MSGYILCHEKRAETPYYIEAAGIKIWTIEELCYYLCQYVWLLDNSFISRELCEWIDKELQMPNLAGLLYEEYRQEGSLKNFIEIVLTNTGYCGRGEISRLTRLLDNMEHVTEMERIKQKGDYFLKDCRYRRAIGMYNRILTMHRSNELSPDFYRKVWNNKGMAYASLFLFEEARFCMKKAMEERKGDETVRAFLGALYLAVPREEFEEQAEAEHISKDAIQSFLLETEKIVPEKYYIPVERLKKEYGRDNV